MEAKQSIAVASTSHQQNVIQRIVKLAFSHSQLILSLLQLQRIPFPLVVLLADLLTAQLSEDLAGFGLLLAGATH